MLRGFKALGIASLFEGRLGARARPMLDYLLTFEEGANRFPGFGAEIEGLYCEINPDGRIRFYTLCGTGVRQAAVQKAAGQFDCRGFATCPFPQWMSLTGVSGYFSILHVHGYNRNLILRY
jgi:hypothetical protein